MGGRVFMTKQFDKQVYTLLQALRVAHGDTSQWEILQAALVNFAQTPSNLRGAALEQVRMAPTDQPKEYVICG